MRAPLTLGSARPRALAPLQRGRAPAALRRAAPGAPVPLRRGPPRAAAGAAAGGAVTRSPSFMQQDQLPEGFDLGLAVALAAAAFEAYLVPSGGAFKEVAVNDTATTYTSKSFLLDVFDGVLEVTVQGAKGLKAVNLPMSVSGPGSDPYCVISVGDSAGKTEVVKRSTDPTWDQTFRLFIRDAEKDLMRVRVYDRGNVRSDIELGAGMLAVRELIKNGTAEVALQGANGQGAVMLAAKWLPFDDPGSAETAALIDEAVADDGPVIPGSEADVTAEEAAGAALIDAVTDAPPGAAEAAAAALRVAGAAAGEGPAVGEAVRAASASAVAAIEGTADKLESKLKKAGVSGKVVGALDTVKTAAVGSAKAAGDKVSGFAEKQGISNLPAKDLTKILKAISSSPSSGKEAEAKAAPAPAKGAAKRDGEAPGGALGLAPEDLPSAWKALAQVAGKALEDVFEAVAYVESPETDTQVWLSRGLSERELVISFRGTEQVKWKDFVADMNLIPQTLDAERTGTWTLGLGQLPLAPFKSFKKSDDIMVHSGFLNAYDSVKVKVFNLVDQITAPASPSSPWRVLVTGHSLGGALATLCAYELAGRNHKTGPGSLEVSMYTYGGPRVGNMAFADAFNERLQGRSWRVTNASDIVPSVPRLMGYAHVATGVRLRLPKPSAPAAKPADTKPRAAGADADADAADAAAVAASAAASVAGVALEFETARDVLGEGRDVSEVITDLAHKAKSVVKGELALEDVVDEIKDQEMGMLNSLMDGSALSQHMEDMYLLALREALVALRPDLEEQVAEALANAEGSGSGSGGSTEA
ncbi:hypothetical protein Rsub_03056 [Raphidocelis subcapitata]|uniref:C2 domain-containing protein n=1 Tax=Raphidocelis subcapitata TaxID=307507 RepID=A0A2V0P0Y9_9CHLO|nr:hypothetical protein Rsub_03056 [Raphidocelis subcapitata]|eukprot:GBF90755.1 hypothetical protein Rsub_03056 [Raphidocelis subcapitata]